MNGIRNMHGWDRLLRVIVGLALAAVGLFAAIDLTWKVVALAVGAMLLITGTVGFCPAYVPFQIGIRSLQRKGT